jgi:hypothetical protein
VTRKLELTERQIHQYGSNLSTLVLLSAFRDNPSDSYLPPTDYAGTSGSLSNINQEGFASCAIHAWPEHLSWDSATMGTVGPIFLVSFLVLGLTL